MSTKKPLRSGPRHCLYSDYFDESAVYLEISGSEFFVRPNKVTVRIPLAIWEHIRDASPARFDLVGLKIDELRAHVTALWRQRQRRIRSSRNPAFERSLGAAMWSGKTLKAELGSGLRWHRAEQRRQRQLITELSRLRKNPPAPSKRVSCRANTKALFQRRENESCPASASNDLAVEQNRRPEVRAHLPVKPNLCFRSGRLSPSKFARLFGVTSTELQRWARLKGGAPTDSRAFRACLEILAQIATWRLICGSDAAFRTWLRSREPMLVGHSPLYWVRRGKLQQIADYVQDALSGLPT